MFGLFMILVIVVAVRFICWARECLEEHDRSGNWRPSEYTEPVYRKAKKYRKTVIIIKERV